MARSVLAPDWFALRGVYVKTCRTLAWLIKTGENVCVCVSELGRIGEVSAKSFACDA